MTKQAKCPTCGQYLPDAAPTPEQEAAQKRTDALRAEELNTKINFGKHAGKTLADILDINPGYIAWAYHHADMFECSQWLYSQACNRMTASPDWTM